MYLQIYMRQFDPKDTGVHFFEMSESQSRSAPDIPSNLTLPTCTFSALKLHCSITIHTSPSLPHRSYNAEVAPCCITVRPSRSQCAPPPLRKAEQDRVVDQCLTSFYGLTRSSSHQKLFPAPSPLFDGYEKSTFCADVKSL